MQRPTVPPRTCLVCQISDTRRKKYPPTFRLFRQQKNTRRAGIKIETRSYGSTSAATLKMIPSKDSGIARPNNIFYMTLDLVCLSHAPMSLPECCPDRGRDSLHFSFFILFDHVLCSLAERHGAPTATRRKLMLPLRVSVAWQANAALVQERSSARPSARTPCAVDQGKHSVATPAAFALRAHSGRMRRDRSDFHIWITALRLSASRPGDSLLPARFSASGKDTAGPGFKLRMLSIRVCESSDRNTRSTVDRA